MDKVLVRLYFIILLSLGLTVLCMPVIVGRTSSWAQERATQVRLLVDGNKVNAVPAGYSKSKGNVVIVMDDGWETQYTRGYATLKKYDMKASVAVVPAYVGTPGYMDYGQLAELYIRGWDMVNHTFDHETLIDLTEEEQAGQIEKGREWLASHYLDRGKDILVFPDGKFSEATIEILKDQGVTAARSLKSLWSAEMDCSFEDVDICNLISDVSLERARAAVNKAIDNHSTVIFVLHKIEPVTDDTQMQLDTEKFSSLVKYIDGKREKLNVLTMTELIGLESRKVKQSTLESTAKRR